MVTCNRFGVVKSVLAWSSSAIVASVGNAAEYQVDKQFSQVLMFSSAWLMIIKDLFRVSMSV